MHERRTVRVNLSLTATEAELLALAAERTKQPPTTFAQEAAVDVARSLIGPDQTRQSATDSDERP